MKKFGTRALACLLVALILVPMFAFTSCTQKKDDTIEITDMAGVKVKIPRSPKKVAAVSPSTGDLMIAFGLGDLLDGTYYSTLNNLGQRKSIQHLKTFMDMITITVWKPLLCKE